MTATRGKYRIQSVVNQTGVSAPTLRTWERRYGVPCPERTQSSYRLYSDEDVAFIRRMQEYLDDGYSAARAAEAARQIADEATIQSTGVQTSPPWRNEGHTGNDPFEAEVDALIEATTAFSPTRLSETVNRIMHMGGAVDVLERAFEPALVRIGEMWRAGRLSIAQEHFASRAIEVALSQALKLVQPADARGTALVACVEDNNHALGIYGAAFRFASWGYHVINLGPETPPMAIADAVARTSPVAVGLSVTIPPPEHAAEAMFAAYGEACGKTPWVVGGRAAVRIEPYISQAGGFVMRGDIEAVKAYLGLSETKMISVGSDTPN